MAKAIGFAGTFYTMWDVETEAFYVTVGNDHRLGGYNTKYTYYQNLSIDLKAAQARFTELTGEKAPDPDTDLHGMTRSFKKHVALDVYEADEFNAGRYAGEKIADCEDISYLHWAFHEMLEATAKDEAKKVLLKNDYVMSLDGDKVITKAELSLELKVRAQQEGVLKELDAIRESHAGVIVVDMKGNLDDHGYSGSYHIPIHFPNYKMMSYNGYDYGLPMVGDKGKRVKGKRLVLLVEVKTCPFLNEPMLSVIEIKSISKIK